MRFSCFIISGWLSFLSTLFQCFSGSLATNRIHWPKLCSSSHFSWWMPPVMSHEPSVSPCFPYLFHVKNESSPVIKMQSSLWIIWFSPLKTMVLGCMYIYIYNYIQFLAAIHQTIETQTSKIPNKYQKFISHWHQIGHLFNHSTAHLLLQQAAASVSKSKGGKEWCQAEPCTERCLPSISIRAMA